MNSLPKIIHPSFPVTIPSTGEEIRIRPFLVREEKIAMMAAQGGDIGEQLIASINILSNCIVESPGEFAVANLTLFDFEYVFLNLRGVSQSNILNVSFTPDPEKAPDETVSIKVDISEVAVQQKNAKGEYEKYVADKQMAKVGKSITLSGDIGVVIKYPTLAVVRESMGIIEAEREDFLLFKMISRIYDKDSVYADFSKEEFEEFFLDMTSENLANLEKFLNTFPVLRYESKLEHYGKEYPVVLEGMQSFFV